MRKPEIDVERLKRLRDEVASILPAHPQGITVDGLLAKCQFALYRAELEGVLKVMCDRDQARLIDGKVLPGKKLSAPGAELQPKRSAPRGPSQAERILEALQAGPATVGQLAESLDILATSASAVLQTLHRHGKIKVVRRKGNANVWGLADAAGSAPDAQDPDRGAVLTEERRSRMLELITGQLERLVAVGSEELTAETEVARALAMVGLLEQANGLIRQAIPEAVAS